MSLNALGVEKFAAARAAELGDLHAFLDAASGASPPARHLRRRTNAHLSYRRSQGPPADGKARQGRGAKKGGRRSGGGAPDTKKRRVADEERPRRHRRRPAALLAGKGGRVLETHLWQVKRMVMEERWGMVLPKRHAGRGVRSAVRLAAEGCVVRDASHLRALRLVAPLQLAVAALCRCCDPSDPRPQRLLEDAAEVSFVLHGPQRFPSAAIGPVRAFAASLRELWVWVHPAAAAAASEALAAALAEASGAEAATVEAVGSVEGEASLRRFELRGANATAALSRVLLPAAPAEEGELRASAAWWCGHRDDPVRLDDGAAVELLCCDFRELCFPRDNSSADAPVLHRDCGRSALWKGGRAPLGAAAGEGAARRISGSGICCGETRSAVRDALSELSSAQINESRRRNKLCEGSASREPLLVPVLLVSRGARGLWGARGRAFGAGWDVVVPENWAKPLWNALQLGGAAAIGRVEAEFLALQAGLPSFPRDFPETPAGRAFWAAAPGAGGSSEAERRQRRRAAGRQGLDAGCPPGRVSFAELWDDSGETVGEEEWAACRSPRHALPFFASAQQEAARRLRERGKGRALLRGAFAPLQRTAWSSAALRSSAPAPPVPLVPLAMPTAVPLALESCGRGVPLPGAAVYAPPAEERGALALWLRMAPAERRERPLAFLRDWDAGAAAVIGRVTSGARVHASGAGGALAVLEARKLRGLVDAASPFVEDWLRDRAVHALVQNPGAARVFPCFVRQGDLTA